MWFFKGNRRKNVERSDDDFPTFSLDGGDSSLQVCARKPTEAWMQLEPRLGAAQVPPSPPSTCPKGFSRWVCISDTHGLQNKIERRDFIPDGDVLIHAGDLTNTGSVKQISEFCVWMRSLPHAHKIVIAGNHDTTLEESFYEENYHRFHRLGREDDKEARRLMQNCDAFSYLFDSSITLFGHTVFGSPYQPEFCNWAFNLKRGKETNDQWKKIPSDNDILVTHGPPLGHGDRCVGGNRAGCAHLLREVLERVKPKVHIFGHIHEDVSITRRAGTTFINASTCTFKYKPENPPIVFDLENK